MSRPQGPIYAANGRSSKRRYQRIEERRIAAKPAKPSKGAIISTELIDRATARTRGAVFFILEETNRTSEIRLWYFWILPVYNYFVPLG